MDRIGDVLIDQWLWDIEVLSNPWMYIPLLIPAPLFVCFMLIKWVVLLGPVWITPYLILSALKQEHQPQRRKSQ